MFAPISDNPGFKSRPESALSRRRSIIVFSHSHKTR